MGPIAGCIFNTPPQKCFLAALMAVCFAGPQDAKGPLNVSLLKYPAVRADMRVDSVVARKVDLILAKEDRVIKANVNSQHGERKMQPLMAVVNDGNRQILALLSPAQQMRLRELNLQAVGPSELEKPGVAKSVGLTRDQVDKLNSFDQKLLMKVFTGLPQKSASTRQYLATTGKTRRARMEEFARQLLTAAQWRAWISMQGRQLKFVPKSK